MSLQASSVPGAAGSFAVAWSRWFGRRAASRDARRAPCASGDASPGADRAERVFGCGWFDSSLDLRQGLSIREHLDDAEALDALAREWPLEAWLALHEPVSAEGRPAAWARPRAEASSRG